MGAVEERLALYGDQAMRKAQADKEIVCPYCNRTVNIPGGLNLRCLVRNRDTFCHELIDGRGNVKWTADRL